MVGMQEYADRRVGGYSLGMRQRLGLAQAMLGDPAVLVLDEPSNGLDPGGVAWLRGFLRALAGGGPDRPDLQPRARRGAADGRRHRAAGPGPAGHARPAPRAGGCAERGAGAHLRAGPAGPGARRRLAARRLGGATRVERAGRRRAARLRLDDRRRRPRSRTARASSCSSSASRPEPSNGCSSSSPARPPYLRLPDRRRPHRPHRTAARATGRCRHDRAAALRADQDPHHPAVVGAPHRRRDLHRPPGGGDGRASPASTRAPASRASPGSGDPATIRSVYATSAFTGSYIFALVLGVTGMTGEYRYQTITPTFLATPRRAKVVLGKAGANLVVGLGYGVVAVRRGPGRRRPGHRGPGRRPRARHRGSVAGRAARDPRGRALDPARARHRHADPQPGGRDPRRGGAPRSSSSRSSVWRWPPPTWTRSRSSCRRAPRRR